MGILIGSRPQFGIEYELLPGEQACGSWMFGKCCYWIADQMVGDYDLGASLGDVLTCLPWIVGDNGKRDEPRLYALSASEVMNILDDILWRGGVEDGVKVHVDTPARFKIEPDIDVFDGFRAYCVSDGRAARLMWIADDWSSPRETSCPTELVNSTIQAFYEALRSIEHQSSE